MTVVRTTSHEAFACYQASCRPTTSGGTGGSVKRTFGLSGYGSPGHSDINLAGVRVTYKPDHPDGGPDPGEVVWAKVRFQEDRSQSKDRPVLVIGRVAGTDRLAAIQLTTQSRGRRDELPVGAGSWDRQGRESSVKLGRIIQLDPADYRREGAVMPKGQFDTVIGHLAAHHRTPVTVAASIASILELACYSAACRPPTSGGTGGSIQGQHVANPKASAAIQARGFRVSGDSWHQAFGKGVYLSYAGDTKSAKLYANQGGRDWRTSEVVSATVKLDNPMTVRGKNKNEMRRDIAEQLGGKRAVQRLVMQGLSRGLLEPEARELLRWYDRSMKKTPHGTYDQASWLNQTFGELAKMAGYDGLLIEPTGRSGAAVGGRQVVVFDPSKITVTGARPYAKKRGTVTASGSKLDCMTSAYLTEHGVKNSGANGRFIPLNASAHAALEFACYDASCRPPTSGGTGGSKPRGGVTIPADVGSVAKRAIAAVSGDRAPSSAGPDATLEALYDARGFHGAPRVVSRSDLTDVLDGDDHLHLWRGVHGDRTVARDLIEGDTHRSGFGVFGNGTYFAAHSSSEFPARQEASGYGDNLIRAAIPKNIPTFDDIEAIRKVANPGPYDGPQNPSPTNKRLGKQLVKSLTDTGLKPNEIKFLLDDTGRTAALLGAPAYKIGFNETAGADNVVVLDRRRLIVDSTVYSDDGIIPKHGSES